MYGWMVGACICGGWWGRGCFLPDVILMIRAHPSIPPPPLSPTHSARRLYYVLVAATVGATYYYGFLRGSWPLLPVFALSSWLLGAAGHGAFMSVCVCVNRQTAPTSLSHTPTTHKQPSIHQTTDGSHFACAHAPWANALCGLGISLIASPFLWSVHSPNCPFLLSFFFFKFLNT